MKRKEFEKAYTKEFKKWFWKSQEIVGVNIGDYDIKMSFDYVKGFLKMLSKYLKSGGKFGKVGMVETIASTDLQKKIRIITIPSIFLKDSILIAPHEAAEAAYAIYRGIIRKKTFIIASEFIAEYFRKMAYEEKGLKFEFKTRFELRYPFRYLLGRKRGFLLSGDYEKLREAYNAMCDGQLDKLPPDMLEMIRPVLKNEEEREKFLSEFKKYLGNAELQVRRVVDKIYLYMPYFMSEVEKLPKGKQLNFLRLLYIKDMKGDDVAFMNECLGEAKK